MLNTMAKVVRLRVGDLLRERNMSSPDLAEKAGVAPLTARQLAKGRSEALSLTTITKVCNALEVEPGELFSYMEEDSQ